MHSFRQKLYLTYLLIFVIFITLIFPLSEFFIKRVYRKALADRAQEVITLLKEAPNEKAMIEKLRKNQPLIFFRVALINQDSYVLYDTHTDRTIESPPINHPEIQDAFVLGVGYHEEYSETFERDFSYLARSFTFQGKQYVLRFAMTYNYVTDIIHEFAFGFFILATAILLLFSVLTFLLIDKISAPIRSIIASVKPFNEDKEHRLPYINLSGIKADNDFNELAKALNLLSEKVEKQIGIITNERNEKSSLLESLVEGVIAVDSTLTITYANKAACLFLKKEKDELIGKAIESINQEEAFELVKQSLREASLKTTTLQLKSDERPRHFDVLAVPIVSESVKGRNGAILIFEDKTEHYRIIEMRKDFVANASHELKTPLTVMRGYAETLYDNPNLPQDKVLQITETIVKTCDKMTFLIKDLLTLADIEKLPEARVSHVDLEFVVETCKKRLLESFPTATIKIEKDIDTDYSLQADEHLLEQLFYNLINNAAKYSHPPASITISFKSLNNKIAVIIADQGIGIPENEIKNIFERFYTVNKRFADDIGATGLGLSIVKTITEKHYGTIDVTSTVGKGTTFTITLPKNLDN